MLLQRESSLLFPLHMALLQHLPMLVRVNVVLGPCPYTLLLLLLLLLHEICGCGTSQRCPSR